MPKTQNPDSSGRSGLPRDQSVWGTADEAMSLRPSELEEDPERYPLGRWTGEEVDEYTAALAVISHVVMRCTSVMWEELKKPESERDQARFERFNDIQDRAWRDRARLDLKDHEAVAEAIRTYSALADELERE
ncbi:MAG: hypothetical protein ACRDQZ_23025 [Mycobacteriales bacterium]